MNIRSIFGFLPPNLLYSHGKIPVVNMEIPGTAIIFIDIVPGRENIPDIKVGDEINTGQRILSGDNSLLAFSPVTGRVKKIYEVHWIDDRRYRAIDIETGPKDCIDPQCKGHGNYLEMEKDEARSILEKAGYNLTFPAQPILNFLESDLSVSINTNLLIEHGDILKDGVQLLKKITASENVVIAITEKLKGEADKIFGSDKSTIIKVVKSRYPNGMKEILPGAVSRNSDNYLVFSPGEVMSMISLLKNGHPSLDKMISLIGTDGQPVKNFRVRIGTPVEDVLSEYNLDIGENDKLVLGGAMRGRAAYHTHFPVTADTDAVFIQRKNDIMEPGAEPCVGCGRCVWICPLKLQVNLLARYSEFSVFQGCRDLDIDFCIECGLCSYVCMSRRPLVQFITFAKRELEKIKEEDGDAV